MDFLVYTGNIFFVALVVGGMYYLLYLLIFDNGYYKKDDQDMSYDYPDEEMNEPDETIRLMDGNFEPPTPKPTHNGSRFLH